jgi:hypothetical protein
MDSPVQLRPTSIRIFLADGSPEGILGGRQVQLGRSVVSSRTHLARAVKREEFSRPGVYALTGPSDGGGSRIYVGEADVLRSRINDHASNKDFRTRVVTFTSTDESLNKGLIRYLESRLVDLARTANQWEVENASYPREPPLSEADTADAEWFLAEMLLIFPILGIDAFESASDDGRDLLEVQDLVLQGRGADARGREVGKGFVVLKGSLARKTETRSIHGYLRDLRTELQERGVLVPDGKHLRFTQDYRFESPSPAAGVVVGGTANGRLEWKGAKDGRTLKEIQDSRTDDVP